MKYLYLVLLVSGMGMGQDIRVVQSGIPELKTPESHPCPICLPPSAKKAPCGPVYVDSGVITECTVLPTSAEVYFDYAIDSLGRHCYTVQQETLPPCPVSKGKTCDAPEPQFVPAVKKTRPHPCTLADLLSDCFVSEEYWACEDHKRVLLHSEDYSIHTCMRIPYERGER